MIEILQDFCKILPFIFSSSGDRTRHPGHHPEPAATVYASLILPAAPQQALLRHPKQAVQTGARQCLSGTTPTLSTLVLSLPSFVSRLVPTYTFTHAALLSDALGPGAVPHIYHRHGEQGEIKYHMQWFEKSFWTPHAFVMRCSALSITIKSLICNISSAKFTHKLQPQCSIQFSWECISKTTQNFQSTRIGTIEIFYFVIKNKQQKAKFSFFVYL